MKVKPRNFLKTVTTAGTSEQLTTSGVEASAIAITAEVSNTGRVYVGDDQVSSTNYGYDLGAGDAVILSAVELGWVDARISIQDIWLDVSVSTDGVSAAWLERV